MSNGFMSFQDILSMSAADLKDPVALPTGSYLCLVTAPQPAPETEPMPPNNEQPPFFRPTPAPLPRRHEPSRRSVVSAPVSRESGLLSDGFDRKQQHTLSAAEAEAAKISGVTPTEYLKQKLKLQQMKANGEIV